MPGAFQFVKITMLEKKKKITMLGGCGNMYLFHISYILRKNRFKRRKKEIKISSMISKVLLLLRWKYSLFYQACDMKATCITILFWPLFMLLLSEERQSSKTVSFYSHHCENISKGILCVQLIKYPKAIQAKKKKI